MRMAQLIAGTADFLVLRALASGPRHGYDVARWARETTGGVLALEEGALYTALHRMERRGWLRSEWGVSENNRRAKYYTLSAKGRAQLEAQSREWEEYIDAILRVLRAGKSPSPSPAGEAVR
jgi:transcriptional regulator